LPGEFRWASRARWSAPRRRLVLPGTGWLCARAGRAERSRWPLRSVRAELGDLGAPRGETAGKCLVMGRIKQGTRRASLIDYGIASPVQRGHNRGLVPCPGPRGGGPASFTLVTALRA